MTLFSNTRRGFLFVGSSFFYLSIAFSAHADLKVLSKTPVSHTQSQRASAAITATFNQPMVPLNDPTQMGTFCPMEIEPKIKGRCRWLGSQTLSFEPEQALPPGHLYKIRIPKGTTSKITSESLTSDVVWEFETERPDMVSSSPAQKDRWINPNALLFVQLNLPVNTKASQKFVSLEERPLDNSSATPEMISLGVRRATPEEIKTTWPYAYGVIPSTSNVLVLKPARHLKPDSTYRLRLHAGLPVEGGNLGLRTERVIEFESYYTFRATAFPEKVCIPASFRMAFSNPVKPQEFLDHLRVDISTPIPKAYPHEASYIGSRDGARQVYQYLPDLNYQPEQDYHFTVDKDLQDIFGNRLSQDVSFTLSNLGVCPSYTMLTGFGVLEAYLPPRHPVSLVNVSSLTPSLARLHDDQVIPFFLGQMNPQFSAASLSLATRQLSFSAPRNVRYRGYVDFEELMNKEGGFAFLQIPALDPQYGYLKALDNITRIGVTFKSSPESSLIWTSFLKTGAPAGKIPVELRDDSNRVLWQGLTNAQGFVEAPGWGEFSLKTLSAYQRPRLWAFAKDPKGTAVLSSDWQGGVDPWRFNLAYDWAPRTETYRGYLFTERGVYRPGEKVYAKGILRKLQGGDWKLSDISVLQVLLTDARGAEVARSTVSVSQLSSFQWSYVLSEQSPTGWWTLRVTTPPSKGASAAQRNLVDVDQNEEEEGEQPSSYYSPSPIDMSEAFRVEAFKPASFEVKVTPQQKDYFRDELFQAMINGWYLFGAPMTQAQTEWKLRLSPSVYVPPGWETFQFGHGWWQEQSLPQSRLLASGKETLDSRGATSVKSKLQDPKMNVPAVAILEASVSSPDRQTLFGRASVVVHPAQVYLGIKASEYFAQTGQEWSASIVAVRPEGTLISGQKVTGRLIRRQWMSVERSGVAGRLEWISETRDTVVSTFSFVSADGPHSSTWTLQDPGQYILEVTAKDQNKRQIQSAISFYAMGKGTAWWDRTDTDIIEILPDKRNYKPGETARLFVKSPYAHSRVMVTLEREGVMKHWLTTLDGAANFIEVPLKDEHVPNVYVGVMLVQGRSGTDRFSDVGDDLAKPQVKFGYANLAVDPGGRRLTVRVKTDKNSYRPRERVTVTLQTLTEKNERVPAELTVYAVDEGVLSLTAYTTPDPFAQFYGPRPLRVGTSDSRLHIIGQRHFGEKGQNRGGGGGGSAALEGIDLRSQFVPTAYWNPSVETDAQGMAKVSFTLPDNLSRFRVMAVAASGKRFGSGESKLVVSKPLLMRPSLPRFARLGDSFQAGIVLHNYSQKPTKARVALELAGAFLQVEGTKDREIEVGAGKAIEVTWSCKAVALGKQTLRFRTSTGQENDGLEWTIPITPSERLQAVATSGVVEGEGVELLENPKGRVPELGGVTASFSPSALAGLQEGARFLLNYPYGCLEQRLSRSLPIIVGSDLVTAFKLGNLNALKADVQNNLDRLTDFQHASGGFGYWPNSWLPDPYITAYALEVTHLASQEGYHVPDAALSKAVTWLKSYLNSRQTWAYPYSESEEYAARAYVLYVLAQRGQPLPNYFMDLYQRRDQLSYSAKAFLFKAAPLISSDPHLQQTLEAELMNQARQAPTTLHFEEPEERRRRLWLPESNVSATARILQVFLEAKGGFAGDQKAVQWLIHERKNKGAWRTTQENALVLRALQDFYRRYEKDPVQFTAVLSKDTAGAGAELWREKFLERTLTSRTKSFTFNSLFGPAEQVRLKLRKEGSGRLYYTLRMHYAPLQMDQPVHEGLRIEKSITPLYGKGKELKAGSRAIVKLKVTTPQDRTFVALEDPLPAGFEIVDPSFAVESTEDAQTLAETTERNPYWGTFHRNEKYDDRILIFADYLTAGEHTYHYLVQATTPGEFRSPATVAEGMYEPEVFGHTASNRVEIKR